MSNDPVQAYTISVGFGPDAYITVNSKKGMDDVLKTFMTIYTLLMQDMEKGRKLPKGAFMEVG